VRNEMERVLALLESKRARARFRGED
jgi:hypothetical protein